MKGNRQLIKGRGKQFKWLIPLMWKTMIKNYIIRFFRRFSKLCRSSRGKGAVWYTSKDLRKKHRHVSVMICDYKRCPFC